VALDRLADSVPLPEMIAAGVWFKFCGLGFPRL